MSAHHQHDHHHDHDHASPDQLKNPGYRRVLWIALVVNAAMFAVEVFAGQAAASTALLADAIDFAGDAANYGLTLAVLSMGLIWRARAAWVKGFSMGLFGLAVLGKTAWALYGGTVPEAYTMGVVGAMALAANLGVAWLLYAWREGDANMRAVWLCTRNDAIGNVAVLLAALGVLGTSTIWPDVVVAAVMATLAITASIAVMRQSQHEIKAAQIDSGR